MNDTPATSPSQAINAALALNWQLAVELNLKLLDINSTDVDSLNRLGFAHLQLGNAKEAKASFEKVLELDQYNQIAQRNLTKLKNKGTVEINGAMVSPLMFLEEPGKTRVVACINLAPAATLSSIRCGQEVRLKVKKHTIEIRDDEQTYMAALPDDISFKLSKFIAGGNEYVVIVRSVSKNSLTVFIRELKRGKEFSNQPSFTPNATYVAVGKIDDSADRPDTTATGEEEPEKE